MKYIVKPHGDLVEGYCFKPFIFGKGSSSGCGKVCVSNCSHVCPVDCHVYGKDSGKC